MPKLKILRRAPKIPKLESYDLGSYDRIIAVRVVTLPFMVIGLFFAGWLVKECWFYAMIQFWTPVEATVDFFRVLDKYGEESTVRMRQLQISYSYDWQGKKWNSTQIGPFNDNLSVPYRFKKFKELSSTTGTSENFTASSKIVKMTVYVNPHSPSEAVILPEPSFRSVFSLLEFACIFIGFPLSMWIWPYYLDRIAKNSVQESYHPKFSKTRGVCRWDSAGIQPTFWDYRGLQGLLIMAGVVQVFNTGFLNVVGFNLGEGWFFIVLFFCLEVGALCIFFNFYARYRKYKLSTLILQPYPGEIGGVVKGRICCSPNFCCTTNYRVMIRGMVQSVNAYTVVWERRLNVNLTISDDQEKVLEFEFQIPEGMPESSGILSPNRVQWWIILKTKSDQHLLSFDIPVFPTVDFPMDLRRQE